MLNGSVYKWWQQKLGDSLFTNDISKKRGEADLPAPGLASQKFAHTPTPLYQW